MKKELQPQQDSDASIAESMAKIFRMNDILHTADATALIAHKDKPLLEKNWAVATSVGKAILDEKAIDIIEKKYPLSRQQILELWDEFMNKGWESLQAILADLESAGPDAIEVNYWDDGGYTAYAAVSQDNNLKTTLHLYPYRLIQFFLGAMTPKKEFQKVANLREFESTLAHELYHLFQYQKFPQAMKQERLKRKYWDRRYEYGARLYSLRWLRKQTAASSSERIGLWLARTGILLDIANQDQVRDKVNALFDVKKPQLLTHLRMIFTNYS